MKKIFLIVLSVMMLLFIQVRVGAVITQFEYDLTFTEGVTFNLETGTYGEDDDYSSTTRIRIFYNSLWIRNFTVGLDLEAHHILFWTDTNEYLGYQNLVESTYVGSKFLGNATMPEITIPTNAVKFSIVARHTDEETELIPHDLELDTPIADLNNHTLEEVFENTSLFDDHQLVTNGDFSNGTTGWLLSAEISINDGKLVWNTSNGADRYATQLANLSIGNKYYASFEVSNYVKGAISINDNVNPLTGSMIFNSNGFKSGIYTAHKTTILIDDKDTILGVSLSIDNVNWFNISTLIANKQYSPLYEDTFDNLTDEQIKAQMDEFVFKPYLFIDYETLGFELSTAEMDYWYNVYVRVKEKTDITYDDFFTAVDITPMNESTVTTVDFGLTDPLWLYMDTIGTTEKWIYYDYASNGTGTEESLVVQFDTDFATFKSYSTLSPISGSDYYIQTAETDGTITWWLDTNNDTSEFTNIFLTSTSPFSNTFSPDGLTSYNLTPSPEEVIKEWYDLDFEYLTEAKLLASTYDYIAANYNDWEAEYEILKEYNAISFVNFETTFAFYLRDVVEAEELDLNERIDEWLMDVGLDSTFSKIVIVVVLMAIFAIILALVHAPAILIMIVEAFIVIIFTALGFIPLWMDVVIALLFGGLLYLKLTNGNGGEEE